MEMDYETRSCSNRTFLSTFPSSARARKRSNGLTALTRSEISQRERKSVTQGSCDRSSTTIDNDPREIRREVTQPDRVRRGGLRWLREERERKKEEEEESKIFIQRGRAIRKGK